MITPYIRPIKHEELEALIDLYQHLHSDDAPLPDRGTLTNLWHNILANPMLHYLAAEVDAQLVSSCTLAIIPNLTRGARPYGVIENVVTHVDFRQQGLGRAMLNHALEIAWDENCYKVMLMTGSKRETTFRFYEGAGFNRQEKTAFIAKPRHK
ncbi:MAG: GNAT family N-acetyltransferase [Chloroflexota bacterium]